MTKVTDNGPIFHHNARQEPDMPRTRACHACSSPYLCIIACPFNRILDQISQPDCKLTDPASTVEQDELQITFDAVEVEETKGEV